MKKPAIALSAALAIAIILSHAYSAVFVYYPITVGIQPVSPPIVFSPGSNAGQPDLGPGNTIGVDIGTNNISLSLTLHPTYQHTYYHNLSLIVNNDTKAYYVTFRVTGAASLPSGSAARLLVYNSPNGGSIVADVNLLSTGDTSASIPINAGEKWRIDVYIFIPEGAALPSPTTASVQLIYSTSADTPPSVPP